MKLLLRGNALYFKHENAKFLCFNVSGNRRIMKDISWSIEMVRVDFTNIFPHFSISKHGLNLTIIM